MTTNFRLVRIIPIFLLLLTRGDLHAQLYNTGIFYVSSGTTIYNTGDFTNTAAATYRNDGIVYIGGNIANDQGALPAGSGSTLFNGIATQTLSGAAPFRCLSYTLNNTAGLTLTNRLSIGDGTGGTLTFTAGKITAGTSAQDVYFYPGSGYTGFDATHHIIGYVTKSGATNFTFPVGDGTHMADFDLTNLSGTADFQALYTGSGYGTYNTNGTLATNGVFGQEWWDIHEVTGSSTAQVTLRWNDARKALNHSSPGGLVIAHYTGGAWVSAGGSSSSSAGSSTGTVGPSSSQSSFSPFTFGSLTVPLPIVLGNFSVSNQGCQALLSWSTTTELNAASFEIQQSTDGVNFAVVTTIKANDQPSDYHVTAPQTTKQAFYRIRMIDQDGQFTYSLVSGLSMSCIPSENQLTVYPNPVSAGGVAQIGLISPVARGKAWVEIYDGNGRKVYINPITVNSGTNSYTFPTAHLSQGAYTLRVIGDGWMTDPIQVIR